MKQGFFISIEGTDGSGKTTQIKRLEEYLKSRGYDVLIVREPGGTAIGEKIRSIILDTGNSRMSVNTEMLLYASARAQLVSEVIKPAIDDGKVVIADRFVDSSYVYQGSGRGIDLNIISTVNRVAVDGMMPELTLLLDIHPEIALKRRAAATQMDRIENEKMDFHKKVYEGYLHLALLYPDRIKRIDANRSVEDVFEEIKEYINELIA